MHGRLQGPRRHYQVMPYSEQIGRIIMEDGNAIQIAEEAKKGGRRPPHFRAEVKDGITSLEDQQITIGSDPRRRVVFCSTSSAWRLGTHGSNRCCDRPHPFVGKALTGPARRSKARLSPRTRPRFGRAAPPSVTPKRVRAHAVPQAGQVKTADIAIFSRQLATMMTAGIPLVRSFDIVGRATRTRRCRS